MEMSISEMLKSLNSEKELAAFKIQSYWKKYRLLRALKLKLRQRMKSLRVYTSSLNPSENVKNGTKRVTFCIKVAGLNYELIDLSNYPSRRADIPLIDYKLPVVMLSEYCIGEETEFQAIVDSDMLVDLVEREFLRKCMICNTKRDSLENEFCLVCDNKYLFFHKSDEIE